MTPETPENENANADEPIVPDVEQDARFPSGPWRGFFLQRAHPGKNWMDLSLTFRQGQMRGEGHDFVGHFLVRGTYDLDTGKCWWTKRYVGKHDVSYSGYNEGKGIWGFWQIHTPQFRGGFHIWPLAMGDPTQQRLAETLDLPAEEPVEAPAEEELAVAGAT